MIYRHIYKEVKLIVYMIIGKQKYKFTILIRNNETNKHKSTVFTNDIKTEQELLDLIKKLLEKHYK